VKDDLAKAILFAVFLLAFTAIVIDYKSPYNQCVRGQTEMNENGKSVVYPFPESLAKVQCAAALGGKPD
jgi:hypothetical protein